MKYEMIATQRVEQSIRFIRGQKVLLDADLAGLYGVTTGHLNRAVKRNAGRFPGDFMFQLKVDEVHSLRCQIGISKPSRGELGRKFPELEKRVGKHDEKIDAIVEAIRQLMAPPAKPRREIGFHVRETVSRYRTREHR